MMPVEISQWRATIGCFRVSVQKSSALMKSVKPISVPFSNPQIILVFLLFHRNFNPCSALYNNNTVSCSTLRDNTVEFLAFVRPSASLCEAGSLHDYRTS